MWHPILDPGREKDISGKAGEIWIKSLFNWIMLHWYYFFSFEKCAISMLTWWEDV